MTRAELDRVCVDKNGFVLVMLFFISCILGLVAVSLMLRRRMQTITKDPRNKIVQSYNTETKKVLPIEMGSKRGTKNLKPKKNDWEISFKEVILQQVIGNGNFGDVYKGIWCGTVVAVKIPRDNIPLELMEKFMDEVDLMTKLHHPNIVIFMAACLTSPNVCLVLEYLSNGNMHDFLRNRSQNINLSMLHKFATDIARGMKYLHRRCGIIQRDLKSRNLLIDDSFNVKICDFGLSRYSEVDEAMTHCGTPYWTAPEVIRQESYDEKADVYSFAIVLWELITRDEPYDGMPGLEVAFAAAERGLRPKIPRFCPDEYKVMMEECWDGDPTQRPGFDEILDRLHSIKKEQKLNNKLNMSTANLNESTAKSNETFEARRVTEKSHSENVL